MQEQRPGRRSVFALVLVAALVSSAGLLAVGVGNAAASSPASGEGGEEEADNLEGRLVSTQPMALGGDVTSRIDDVGVIHARASASLLDSSFTLTAAEINVHYTWVKSLRTDVRDGGDPIYEHRQTESDEEERSFSDVSVRIHEDRGLPEILGMLDTSQVEAQAAGNGEHTLDWIEDANLTRVGYSEDTFGPGSDAAPGFWYHVRGPWAGLDGLDSGTLEGNFTFFVNNATLSVTESDQGEWQHWTGVHTRSGPAPGTNEVERRVTVVEVVDGTLDVPLEDGIAVVAPSQTASLEGRLQSEQVDGSLVGEALRYEFSNSSLALEGQGELELRAHAGSSGANGLHRAPTTAGLVVEPDGQFALAPDSEAEASALPAAGSGQGEANGLLLDGLGWPGTLLVLALLGVLVAILGPARDSLQGAWSRYRARRRKRRINEWLATGDEWIETSQPEKALAWYRKVTERYPESAQGWTSLAACLEELGRFGEAAMVYEEASARFAGGDAFFLVAGAHCALQSGEEETAVELARKAAQADAAETASALHDRGLDRLARDERVAEHLGLSTDTEASYYA